MISVFGIDSGNNPNATFDNSDVNTNVIVRFCNEHHHRRVYAVKGSSTADASLFPLYVSKGKHGKIFVIGTNRAKSNFYSRMKIIVPVPGYCHFPKWYFDAIAKYFSEIVSERWKIVKKRSKAVKEWYLPPGLKNNHFWDARAMSLCVYESLNFDVERFAEKLIREHDK